MSKKYRHIPTGDIFRKINDSYYSQEQEEFVPVKLVENPNSKDWKPVEENDYEILSFKNLSGKIILPNEKWQYEWFKALKDFSINSVRRLCDGVEFKVGDRIVGRDNPDLVFIITDFATGTENELNVGMNGGYWPIGYIRPAPKKPEPLWISPNGVEVFEGHTYTTISLPFFSIKDCTITKNHKGLLESILFFKTEAEAEEYVINNKLVFNLIAVK